MTTACSNTGGKAALEAAGKYENEIVTFLRDMIRIPAESLHEGERAERIRQEYEKLGFDEVFFDRLGNVIARIGDGPFKILMDGHFDCVGVGDPDAWEVDPFEGSHENGEIRGRGAVDELPAVACMAYGAKILQENGGVPEGVTLYLSSTVMEEDCDGYCLLHLIEKEGIRPDVVVIGEPTDLGVYRGQRGRVEATITTKGKSAHAAHPTEGVNALYKMARILLDVEELNEKLTSDASISHPISLQRDFLGKGTVVASSIQCTNVSLNAVPDSAMITIDRRVTAGETVEQALEELRALPNIGDATVELLKYEETSWRGEKAEQEKFFPAWVFAEDHPVVQSAVAAVEDVTGEKPRIYRWGFSTNGVVPAGRMGIPAVGFAPGREELAHTVDEVVKVADLVTATAVYSLLPGELAKRKTELTGE
jgi:putative selenium metabolism hydrolase